MSNDSATTVAPDLDPALDSRRARRAATGSTPVLTPFPRPGYLIELRQRRERRRRLVGGTVAAAVAALAIVGAGTAYTLTNQLDPSFAATSAVAEAAQTPAQADVSVVAADVAEAAKSEAYDGVDTAGLDGYISELQGETASADVYGLVEQTAGEVASVESESASAAEEAARAQAEAEAKAAAEAEALAAANTVEGAQATAQQMGADQYGWGDGEFGCLVSLWNKESGWNYQAENASSGAYGIPQALPGSKMGTIADDWATNASTQIAWGLQYISSVYGTPCAAWGHSQSVNWY